MTEFDWTKEKDSIAVRQVDAVAVYLNPDGDVVIRQYHPMGDDDAVIVIPSQQLDGLVLALENLKEGGR